MKHKKKWLFIGVLLAFVIFIRVYADNELRVEDGYSTGIYPGLATLLRLVFGWLPFSIGDLLYGLFGIWILWKLIKGIKALYKKQATWKGLATRCFKILILFLLIYVVFNSFWGINYNRKGIAYQLGFKMDKYSPEELKNINAVLIEKVNSTKLYLVNNKIAPLSTKELFIKVQQSYAAVNSSYPFLNYQHQSLKPSLWGWLGNYVGFLGYYNPFTGEGQVNTTVPKFSQPFTACHEVAHQLGYAKEMEANFVGYLAASASPDKQFQYSVYLDLFLYSNRNLFNSDSVSARSYANQLIPEVKADLKEWRDFNRRHKNPVEPVIRWMYGKYLERNQQPQGVLSYDEVTSFLIAYYKKFGKI
jgi:cytochrome b561